MVCVVLDRTARHAPALLGSASRSSINQGTLLKKPSMSLDHDSPLPTPRCDSQEQLHPSGWGRTRELSGSVDMVQRASRPHLSQQLTRHIMVVTL